MAPQPDFFLVGAPKCGTTAMTRYLRKHPEIYVPPGKEYHYFGSDLHKEGPLPFLETEAEYRSLFENARRDQRVGECSVWYLYSRRAAAEIHEFEPDADILAMVRNPVDVLHSQHRQFLFNGNETLENFREALKAEPDRKRGRRLPDTMIFRQGLYYRETVRFAEQIRRYFEVFGRESVHVIVFDDFVRDTETTYAKVLDFLDVDPGFRPTFERVNPNQAPRFPWLNRLLKNPPWPLDRMAAGAAGMIPPRLRPSAVRLYKAVNVRREKRPPMDPGLRRELLDEFREEIARLEQLLERDLSGWYGDEEPGPDSA